MSKNMGWLASVGLSFVLGFGAAWMIKTPDAGSPPAVVEAPAPAPGAPATLTPFAVVESKPGQVAALPPNAGVDALWARALLPQQEGSFDAEDRLRKLAQADPVALRSLLQRYDSAATPQARELLKSILSTVQKPDVVAFSTRLANSSNLAERKYGFELLQSVAPDAPETRSLVRRTLANEQSPEVLAQALAALRAGSAEPDEAEQVVAQLKNLAQHADPAVRTQSLAQLGQWDKKGEGAERLAQGLADRVPEVRLAAVFAIAQAGLRSEALKAALIGMAGNAQESRDVRGSALQVLERFSLNKEEHASLAKARSQLQLP
jgi:hypothetical protein